MAGQPVSGGKLALVGLALLAVPHFAEGWGVGDVAKAVLLFVPTVLGLSFLVIGLYRLVKSRDT